MPNLDDLPLVQLCGLVDPWRRDLEAGQIRMMCPDWPTRWSINQLPVDAQICPGEDADHLCLHACHYPPGHDARGPVARVTLGPGAR